GDPHAVGLGGVTDEAGHDVERPDLYGTVVDPVPDVEDVGKVVDLPALGRRRGTQSRPGVGRAVHHAALLRGRRMVSAPYEQAGQIKAVVCVQVRQQNVHGVGVGVPLQGTQHAATEIED